MAKIGIVVVAYNAAATLATRARPDPRRVRRADRRHPRLRQRQRGPHVPRRPRLPAGPRAAAAADGHPPGPQPRLRRQPEDRLPVGDRAGLRHRRPAPRRRPVRAGDPARDRDAARGRRGRRRLRVPDDGAAATPCAAACRSTSTWATRSSRRSRTGSSAPTSPSGTAGYRAYSVAALQDIPFEQNSDEYDFDTGIILQLHDAGKRIVELPIPTFYGDEISYVNGMRYAKDIVGDVLRYRFQKLGVSSPSDDTGAPRVAPELAEGLGCACRRLAVGPIDGSCARPLRRPTSSPARSIRSSSAATTSSPSRSTSSTTPGPPCARRSPRSRPTAPAASTRSPPARCSSACPIRPRRCASWPATSGRAERSSCRSPTSATGTRGRSWPAGRFAYQGHGALAEENLRFFTRRSLRTLFDATGLHARRWEGRGVTSADPAPAPGRWSARADAVGLAVAPSLFTASWLVEVAPD